MRKKKLKFGKLQKLKFRKFRATVYRMPSIYDLALNSPTVHSDKIGIKAMNNDQYFILSVGYVGLNNIEEDNYFCYLLISDLLDSIFIQLRNKFK